MSLYKYSDAAQIGITAAFSFLVIADLVGNSLVCAVVLRNRIMRTPMNYLLVNLAAADMTVAVFIAARYIFTLTFPHPKGTAGDVVCQLITGEAFVWVGALASAFSLVCIALERYLAIKFPYDERQRITTTKLKHIVVLGFSCTRGMIPSANSVCSSGPLLISLRSIAPSVPLFMASYPLQSWFTCILSLCTSCGFVLRQSRPWHNKTNFATARNLPASWSQSV